MESLKQQHVNRLRRDEAVLGVLAVDNPSIYSSVTDGFDYLLLVVSRQAELANRQIHYIKDHLRIQERWTTPEQLNDQVVHGEQRNVLYWILKGEILLDREMYLEGLRHRVLEFPEELREHKLLIEFSKFHRSYLQSKDYLVSEQLLDAYNNILEALQHWARIVIVEAGYHPEITVWSQVKTINPGVYKLYEELTLSSETLKQRVQLVLLACEFSVMSKMERCCKPLLTLLASREEAWSIQELQRQPQLSHIGTELPLLLNKLVKKALAVEVVHTADPDLSLLELRYRDVKGEAV
ncbi:Nucleotidyltransferase-like [Paenibacillus sp. UNCCL117]|uniref:nucleotidyltransferase-like protein n=1 Tax=unclassified Paenibacillus TaxID=185978 RepID=UPI00088ECFEA|nr:MULTISPECIES: nucleotidyltransferase-like protein [unclassified Paenibacillus]SDE39774.1 Nucleotidyltransferase-like [Paenibacillus sp. cl123]SFW65251.1 Nucleotidyltransferase-like [Paenibacillus sp. UNCCL117]